MILSDINDILKNKNFVLKDVTENLKKQVVYPPVFINPLEGTIKAVEEMNKSEAEKKAKKEQREIEMLEELKKVTELLKSIGGNLDYLSQAIITNSELTQMDLQNLNELLLEFKQIMISHEDDKDDKLATVLKKSLDLGTQISVPLLVEYIKFKAKSAGINIFG